MQVSAMAEAERGERNNHDSKWWNKQQRFDDDWEGRNEYLELFRDEVGIQLWRSS